MAAEVNLGADERMIAALCAETRVRAAAKAISGLVRMLQLSASVRQDVLRSDLAKDNLVVHELLSYVIFKVRGMSEASLLYDALTFLSRLVAADIDKHD